MKRAALLLCLAGLLAGCGSDDSSGPATLPPVRSTAAPATVPTPTTEAPTPAPVPKPPEADAFTSEGAAAFVRYYIQVINSALHTNDPAALIALSSPDCSGCTNYINSVRGAAMQKATVRTKGLQVRDAVAPAISGRETTVLLDFDADGFTAVDPSGAVVEQAPPQNGLTAELRCMHTGKGWSVLGFRLVQGAA